MEITKTTQLIIVYCYVQIVILLLKTINSKILISQQEDIEKSIIKKIKRLIEV